jgi:hypothetical protein
MRAYSQQQSSIQDVMLGKLLPFASLVVIFTSKSNNNTMPSLTNICIPGQKQYKLGQTLFTRVVGNG